MDFDVLAILAASAGQSRVLWQALLPTAGVALAIGILIWGVMRLGEWTREKVDPATQVQEMLTEYRNLHEDGELTDEEYRSIKGRLISKNVLPGQKPVQGQAPSTKEPLTSPASVTSAGVDFPINMDPTGPSTNQDT